MLDDLFTYRLAPDRFLTVTNASNHEKDLAWFQRHARRARRRGRGPLDDYAMLAVQGPRRARARPGARRRAAAGALHRRRRASSPAAPRSSAAPATPARTASSSSARREAAARDLGRRHRRGAVPAGLAARDTLRLEVCFHLYGNDLMESRGPIEAGLGWCCKEDTGFIGVRAPCARRARPGRPRSSSPFRSPARASPARATRSSAAARSPAARCRPSLDIGIGMAYVPAERAEPGDARFEIDVRGKRRPAVVAEQPLYRGSAA